MNKKAILSWIAAAVLCAAGIAVFLLLRGLSVDNPAAAIYLDGKLYRTLSLSEDTELAVESERGYNVVTVKDGAVSVTEADCPDKICVKSGAVSGGAVPIICLPHRLAVRIISAEEGNIDAQIN